MSEDKSNEPGQLGWALMLQSLLALMIAWQGAGNFSPSLSAQLANGYGETYFRGHLALTGAALVISYLIIRSQPKLKTIFGERGIWLYALLKVAIPFYFGVVNLLIGLAALTNGQGIERTLILLFAPGITFLWAAFHGIDDNGTFKEIADEAEREEMRKKASTSQLIHNRLDDQIAKLNVTWTSTGLMLLILMPLIILGRTHFDIVYEAVIQNDGIDPDKIVEVLSNVVRFCLILIGVFAGFGAIFYPLSRASLILWSKFVTNRKRILSVEEERYIESAIDRTLVFIDELNEAFDKKTSYWRATWKFWFLLILTPAFFFTELLAFTWLHSNIRSLLGIGDGVILWHDNFGVGTFLVSGLALAPRFLTGHFLVSRNPIKAIRRLLFAASDGNAETPEAENRKILKEIVIAVRGGGLSINVPFDPRTFLLSQYGWRTWLTDTFVFIYIIAAPAFYFLDRRDHDVFTNTHVIVGDYWTGKTTSARYEDLLALEIRCGLTDKKKPAVGYKVRLTETLSARLGSADVILANLNAVEAIDRKLVAAGVPVRGKELQKGADEVELLNGCLRKLKKQDDPDKINRLFKLLRAEELRHVYH